MRIILHIDLDAFYASCEERERPELKGKPLVIGADPKAGKGRGVVSTCSYPARKFGIRSGMPISRAWNLCPGPPQGPCIYLPVNFDLYIPVSQAVFAIARKYAYHPEPQASNSGLFEQAGIDEAFLDVSRRCKNFAQAEELAKNLKDEIKQKERLTCSVGIGPNKLIAKIASDFRKPDGLTVVKSEQVASFLSPLSARKLIGVGPKTEAFLKEKGIEKIGQLRKIPKFVLIEWLGKSFGAYLYEASRGVDDSPLVEKWEPKSFGREWTFEKDTKEKALLHSTLENLAEDVAEAARTEGFSWKTVTLKVRYADFETHTSQKSLTEPAQDGETSLEIAKALLRPYLESPKKIRLIGFRVSGLARRSR
jgi:nucleotidyltransferase/DNA polymerase involved in DNA repair